MSHYVRLGVLFLRTMGLVALLYSVPMLLWAGLRVAAGATKASDGVTNSNSVLMAWVIYAIAGLLLFGFARPLARIAARGLDEPASDPAAA